MRAGGDCHCDGGRDYFPHGCQTGPQDSDSKLVADMLRRSGKPVVLVVNKVDSFEKFMPDVYEFYYLGIGDPFPISAASMLGLGDMLDEVVKHFPDYAKDEEERRPKVAIIGKPNVGGPPSLTSWHRRTV